MSDIIERLFPRARPVIAVIHTGPSPGVPGCSDVRCAADRAVAEARMLVELGVDGLLIENAHDAPATRASEMGPEVVAFMTRVASAVKRHAERVPVGVRVLEDANQIALAVAYGAGCDFIRVDGWGLPYSDAATFHRYRRALGATRIPVIADIRASTVEDALHMAETAEACKPDALAVLGPRVGQSPAIELAEAVIDRTSLPVFIGGGLNASNLDDYIDTAHGFLVGSGLKEAGRWQAPVCEPSVRALIGALEYVRGQEVNQ